MRDVRLTLLNPHADDFIKLPVSFWLVQRRALVKYAYLLDEPLSRGDHVDILVDGTLSAVFGQTLFLRLPRWLRLALLWIEIALWKRINGLDDRVVVHWSARTIADREFLCIFSYKGCVGAFAERKKLIDQFRHKIINLSHYFIRTSEKAANIAQLDNVTLMAESDLRENAYFRKYFPGCRRLLVLPFAVASRFTVRVPISERRGICVATGSFHSLRDEEPAEYYEDFLNFFGMDTYHPVRKLLNGARAETGDWLTCRVSPYREMSGRSRVLTNLVKALRLDAAQSRYFSFDIVALYNDHKFAIVGEEVSGLPAVGFFEAMACGCVMLGQQGSFYAGLGIVPGVHYLTHDGSVDGIRRVIDEALSVPGRVEEISRRGRAYVEEHCTSSAVWNSLQHVVTEQAAAA